MAAIAGRAGHDDEAGKDIAGQPGRGAGARLFARLLTMARKPPDWRQPSLFPPDPGNIPQPEGDATQELNGGPHAVQDDHSRTPATTAADARAAAEGPQAPAGNGTLRQGAETEPRSLEGDALPAPAGQRPAPDLFGGTGNSSQGAGGSFAHRVKGERERVA